MKKANVIRLEHIRTMPVPIPRGERHRHKLDQLKTGGFFGYNGEVYKVMSRSEWLDADDESVTSVELSVYSLSTGESQFFEFWNDLGLQAIRSDKRFTASDLGIDPTSLEELGQINALGAPYKYDDDYPMKYRGSDGTVEKLHLYLFANAFDQISLQIWESGEFDAWRSVDVDLDDIEILVLGEG